MRHHQSEIPENLNKSYVLLQFKSLFISKIPRPILETLSKVTFLQDTQLELNCLSHLH